MKRVDSISLDELVEMQNRMYGEMVKAVADIDRGILVVDAELHADEEAFLLEQGSQQQSLWGFNVYPDEYGTEDFIEFDSMINVRPSQGNRSRSVESPEAQAAIRALVDGIVHE